MRSEYKSSDASKLRDPWVSILFFLYLYSIILAFIIPFFHYIIIFATFPALCFVQFDVQNGPPGSFVNNNNNHIKHFQ